ncbi:MAG TPA: TPM domain-containing protein [Saprospiraceae bacterium]|nr:TPM domain-containing protein [Saprospiraceae bacterium]HMP23303.1 TPM domain-containing protein [Saprospiraceae bacterium]
MMAFFTAAEEARIVAAIQAAERNTSGEIRVHIEKRLEKDVLTEAQRTFAKLGMHRTQARNGVLIFIAPEHHQFAIIGDQGIHQQVGEHFWQAERDLIATYFRQGDFAGGICAAVEQVGEKLKAFFPFQSDDTNELPDEISYGKDR